MVFKETTIKNIKEVTEPLKEEILKGDVHTVEEMKAWLQAFGYSDAIKDATMVEGLNYGRIKSLKLGNVVKQGNELTIRFDIAFEPNNLDLKKS